MAAADNGVHRDTLADACRRYLLADGVDDAIEFMADDAGIFRERVVAVIDVYIGTTDPAKAIFTRTSWAPGTGTGRDSMFSWPGSLTTTLLILIPSIVFFLNKLRYFYYHTSMQKIIIRPGSHLRKLGRKSHGMINLLK